MNFLSSKATGFNQHIAVLPIGGFDVASPLVWSKEALLPAVKYVVNGVDTGDTYFSGFVLTPIKTGANKYLHPLYTGFGELPTVQDWQTYMALLFTDQYNLKALEELAVRPLDIWIGLPYPIISQTNFGVVNGKSLSFANQADREEALKWWINTFLSTWNQQGFTKLNLKGFYWLRESLIPEDESPITNINQHIHTQGYKTMWLPNYGGFGVTNPWKGESMNFDLTAINTNYYGNTPITHDWINHSSNFAKFYKAGLQINIGKGITFNQYHLYDFLNLGLPHRNNYIDDCVLVFNFYDISIQEFARDRNAEYQQIYLFMKKLYVEQSYPGRGY